MTTVQEELISEIEALAEEYIMNDDTYQDIYKELNWLNIGEDGSDFRLNIEIRRIPPRTMYCIGGVNETASGVVLNAE